MPSGSNRVISQSNIPCEKVVAKEDNGCAPIKRSDVRRDVPLSDVKYNIEALLANANPKYRVVFDIDDTLTCILANPQRSYRYPQSYVLSCDGESYYVFPDFEKVFISLLCWGWAVDFFSLGTQGRNEELIPKYLKTILSPQMSKLMRSSPYHWELNNSSGAPSPVSVTEIRFQDSMDTEIEFTKELKLPHTCGIRMSNSEHNSNVTLHSEIHRFYERMVRMNRFRLFSRHHAHTWCGSFTKDLRVVSSDVENTILVDDSRDNACNSGQLPFIGVCYRDPGKFNLIGHDQCWSVIEEQYDYNPVDNAAYIMGILLECKELIDSKSVRSLRGALDRIMRHEGKSAIKRNDVSWSSASRNAPYSPWYLLPYKEFELAKSKGIKKENVHYYKQMTAWIEKGKEHFRRHF